MKLEIPQLIRKVVRLEPFLPVHREPLRVVANDNRIWQHTLTRASGPGFDDWFDDAVTEWEAGRRAPYVVCRNSDGAVIGSTSYLDIQLRHRRIEIGATWYHPDFWKTAVNAECKLLLLRHAFETLKVNRVALVTDAQNLRSQAAIAKLGAVREGVLRSHMLTQNDRIRDSVFFSIIASEWPQVRDNLEARLARLDESQLKMEIDN